MELRRTEQGFALYKEKDCIGECTLSPAPKGAQLAALYILPRWRRTSCPPSAAKPNLPQKASSAAFSGSGAVKTVAVSRS